MSTSQATAETLSSLQEHLQPIAENHGQHSQLEAWLNDSCQALEKLHSELTVWQNELARKQTELDLREDALDRSRTKEDEFAQQVEQWKSELAAAREEATKLQEENADHLEQLEELERRCFDLESELKTARHRAAELEQALQEEQSRAEHEQNQWKAEFKEMRELLDKQCEMLASQFGGRELGVGESQDPQTLLRSQELRLRAQARLAEKRRQLEQSDSSSEDAED